MTGLPLDAEPLAVKDCWVWAEGTHWSVNFYLYRQNNLGNIGTFAAGSVQYPTGPTWRVPRPEELRAKINMPGWTGLSPDFVRAMAEIYMLMAEMATVLEEGNAGKLEEARIRAEKDEADRLERDRVRRAEEAIRHHERHLHRMRLAARQKFIFDLIKWQLGEKIKLTRDGKRATVFGTIDHVEDSYMNITTEKGKFMNIRFVDINKLWIKEGSARRYDVLYTAGDEPEPKLDEQKEVTA